MVSGRQGQMTMVVVAPWGGENGRFGRRETMKMVGFGHPGSDKHGQFRLTRADEQLAALWQMKLVGGAAKSVRFWPPEADESSQFRPLWAASEVVFGRFRTMKIVASGPP